MSIVIAVIVCYFVQGTQGIQLHQGLSEKPHVHEVIVIGAGVAGIATSKTLSDHGHEHLILEGRRRIGGRIEAGDLSGTKVDLGATFVHNPSQKNMIYELIQNISWPTVPAHMSYIEELYKPGVTQDSTIKREASAFINRFHTWIPSYLKGLDHDIGLSSSWALFEKAQNQKLHSKALYQSYFQLITEGLLSGADVSQISSSFYARDKDNSAADIIPVGGYPSLLKAIFKRYCHKAQIKLNKVVTEVDYSGPLIKVTTKDKDVFYAKRVVSSLPLGVLKAGDVSFIPQLPPKHREAIDKIGFGVFNKIIISFSERFWGKGKKVLNFIPSFHSLDKPQKFVEGYIVSDNDPSLVMFFTGGSGAKQISSLPDKQIISQLLTHIKSYLGPRYQHLTIKDYTITRWEQDPFAKGSYSFHTVGTKKVHFQTLSSPIQDRLFFIGEHTDPKFSSNVHGAFRAGILAGERISAQLSLKKGEKKIKR